MKEYTEKDHAENLLKMFGYKTPCDLCQAWLEAAGNDFYRTAYCVTCKKFVGIACDDPYAYQCREYRYERMESALKVIRAWAAFDLKNSASFSSPVALDREAVVKLCDRVMGGFE